ncbi:MAG TPA: peptidoglycan editing factor PgeF [Solirubrobacteraceae bacterium]|nr:peptidoglycan editing factor PgeF [Solirubrobacteraceae bacterium]
MRLPAPFRARGEHLEVTLGGARALFTTRRGGCSSGPFHSLNLGRLTADRPQDVERNRQLVRQEVGRPLGLVRQVHGPTVIRLDAPPPDAALAEADGIVTSRTDAAAAVLVADCLPVVVAGQAAVAALHAGWRGLADGVLDEGVRALRESGEEGTLEAAIGPGIGVCCYEVGEEVHRAFASYGATVRRGRNLDLEEVARCQLERAGVGVVHSLGLCTSCHPELFFSHRRDRGVTGRQAGVAWLG